MIFSNSINVESIEQIQPTMRGQTIERKTVAKFLGILINNKLTWTDQIKLLHSKLSRNCGILFRLKGVLPHKAMMILYHSFIQSHMNYCSSIWGLGSKHSINSLFVCQKKAIRALMPGFVNYYYDKNTENPPAHTKQAFNSLNILTIHSLILKNALLFLFKVYHMPHHIPSATRLLFHDFVGTARRQHLVIHTNSMFVKGVRLFREIKQECKDNDIPLPTHSIGHYKSRLKYYLFKLQSSGEENEWEYSNFRLCNQLATRQSSRLKHRNATDVTTL